MQTSSRKRGAGIRPAPTMSLTEYTTRLPHAVKPMRRRRRWRAGALLPGPKMAATLHCPMRRFHGLPCHGVIVVTHFESICALK